MYIDFTFLFFTTPLCFSFFSQSTQVNLNFMLCPADKDPFNGPYYRLAAVFHQAFCLLTLGKIYSLVLHLLIPSGKKKKS